MSVHTKFSTVTREKTTKKTRTETLRDLLREQERSRSQIAIICYEIMENEEWKNEGYESLKEYINAVGNEFDFPYATFMGYAEVGRFIKQNGFTDEEVEKYGFTKIRESIILTRFSKENIRAILEKAKDMSIREYREQVLNRYREFKERDRKVVNLDEAEPPSYTATAVPLSPPPYTEEEKEEEHVSKKDISIILTYPEDIYNDIVQPAFDIAEEMSGYTDRTKIFLFILVDYISHHHTDLEVIKTIKNQIENAQR